MIKGIFLSIILSTSSAFGSTLNAPFSIFILEYCEGDTSSLSVVDKLYKLEKFISGRNITYEEFVSNPNHNEYFLALKSKDLRGFAVWDFYEGHCNKNFYTFLDYILN